MAKVNLVSSAGKCEKQLRVSFSYLSSTRATTTTKKTTTKLTLTVATVAPTFHLRTFHCRQSHIYIDTTQPHGCCCCGRCCCWHSGAWCGLRQGEGLPPRWKNNDVPHLEAKAEAKARAEAVADAEAHVPPPAQRRMSLTFQVALGKWASYRWVWTGSSTSRGSLE